MQVKGWNGDDDEIETTVPPIPSTPQQNGGNETFQGMVVHKRKQASMHN